MASPCGQQGVVPLVGPAEAVREQIVRLNMRERAGALAGGLLRLARLRFALAVHPTGPHGLSLASPHLQVVDCDHGAIQ